MSSTGISRNIPAAQRHHLLDRWADISQWPGNREIRAQVIKDHIRVTYEGQGGYICLRIRPDDNFEKRLAAIDRLIEHDIQIARIMASQIAERIECDYDEDADFEVGNDMPPPLWSWTVPEIMAIAYHEKKPEGLKAWIDKALRMPGSSETERVSSTDFSIRTVEIGGRYESRVELFSASNQDAHLTSGTKHYLRIRGKQLPATVLASMVGRPSGEFITHPFLHPEVVIHSARQEKGDTILNLWKNRSVLADPPLMSLQEVNEAFNSEIRRTSKKAMPWE